jgi:hypothetical protein
MAGYLIAAVVFALAGGVSLGVGVFERHMAVAEEGLVTLRYDEAREALSEASKYAEYGRWIPGAGSQVSRDLQTREASLQYWQRQYDALLPREADPVGAVDADNGALQLLVADCAYRTVQAKAVGREATIQLLDETIAGYLTVLSGDRWDERAAYNYEYLVRVRDELARGRRKALPPPDEKDAAPGEAGAPAASADMQSFEIYIPLEGEERNDASEAGKAAPPGRKG